MPKHSQRAGATFLAVNCAAIPADIMESQLFGHKAGAFTGANADHAGYFQQADLGTLFLVEELKRVFYLASIHVKGF